jgi:spoIIIJ-associated protein
MKYTVDVLRPKLDGFLAPVLDQAGFAVSYELRSLENPHPEVENPEVSVIFSGEDDELLLANRAELLLALEHLTMEALRLPPEDHSLISFDCNDFRLLRVEELRLSALAAAEKVKRTRVPFHFNPMTSRERRIIHIALRNEKDLRSESVGVGPARAVVIVPSDMPTPPAPPAPPRPPYRGATSGRGGERGNDRRGPRRDDRPAQGNREGQNRGGGNRPFRGGGNRGNR